MYSFLDLSTTSLELLISTYRAALAAEAAGEVNYPCGSPHKQVTRWLKLAEDTLANRLSADSTADSPAK